MQKTVQTNKMAVMPIPTLLISMGAPMMLSMLTQAFYNVVDTFFVSHIPDTAAVSHMGDKAINALTLAFPIQMLITCLGVGTGVGTGAALAMYTEKEPIKLPEMQRSSLSVTMLRSCCSAFLAHMRLSTARQQIRSLLSWVSLI